MAKRKDFAVPAATRAGERNPRRERKQIVAAIAEMARELGRNPSLAEFVGRSGIVRHRVRRIFSRWNEAVSAAGLVPQHHTARIGKDELLKEWGEAVRKNGGLPSQFWQLKHGRHDPRTFSERFGGWDAMPSAFLKFAQGKPEWNDVAVILEREIRRGRSRSSGVPIQTAARGRPEDSSREVPESAPRAGRAICGNPMSFRGMRYEPVNEQGVVLLFGMMAEELGYTVESAQTAFPDCEAKRCVGLDMWQHVRIEFEFESRNFLRHGHPLRGCDVIVCWRHNWKECPKEIEVVELAEILRR